MSKRNKEKNHVRKNVIYQGNRGKTYPHSHIGKNPAIPHPNRSIYRKTVYPSHEKRNRRLG